MTTKKPAEKADAKPPTKNDKDGGGAPKELMKPKPAAGQLKPGDEAPAFEAYDEAGMRYSLGAYRGKTVVLYFYPKDNTPGCTQEACDFKDSYSGFEKKGVTIFGVSGDSAKSHQSFKSKYNFAFPLLVDEDLAICKAYGAWGEKSMYGKKFDGIIRSTFIIDKEGKIKQAWYKVSVAGHAKAVLEAV
jgi:peroxiredoxin Q/BCP